MMNIAQILKLALEKHASDIHLAAEHAPIFRCNGDIVQSDLAVLTDQNIQTIREKITPLGLLSEKFEVDFIYHFENIRFRVHAFQQQKGLSFTLRIIPAQIPS